MVPGSVPYRAIHNTQQDYSWTDASPHPARHIESSHSTPPRPHSSSHVTYSTVSVGAADIPYMLHRTHATNLMHSGRTPHPVPRAAQHSSHATHAHHSVHFSDTTHQVYKRTPRSAHMLQTSTASQVSHSKNVSTSLQSHTPYPTPPVSSAYHHTTPQSQPIHSTLSSQSKQHTPQSIYYCQTAHPFQQINDPPSHHASQRSTYSACTPHSKAMDYTMHIPHTAYYTHDISSMHPASLPDPTAKTSHIGYQNQTAVIPKPTTHSPPRAVCSVHDAHHPSCISSNHSSHQSSGYTTTTLPPTKPVRSSHLSSQPTVWRHSWTEGEDKEQRVWGGSQERVGVTPTSEATTHFYDQEKSKHDKESHHESRSGEITTTGELTSLLRRFDRRTPSEQSLLVVERDEDTLI